MPRLSLPWLTLALVVAHAGAAAGGPLLRSQRADLLAGYPRSGCMPAARVQADTDGNRLFDDLEAQLAGARAEEAVPVIVRYRAGRQAVVASARRVDRALPLDGSIATRLTCEEIRRLAASGAVESI